MAEARIRPPVLPRGEALTVWERENRFPHVRDYPGAVDTSTVRLSDDDLLELADRSAPSMRHVAASLRSGDKKSALAALAKEFRCRPLPVSPFPDADPDALIREADRLAKGCFEIVGITHCFPGGKVDWLYNPTAQPGRQYDKAWTYTLLDQRHFVTLARAFRLTGDPKYRDALLSQFNDFQAHHPRPNAFSVQNDTPLFYTIPAWSLLTAAMRSGHYWLPVFGALREDAGFSDSAVIAFVKGFYDHAVYLERFHTIRNWLLIESASLYRLGVFLEGLHPAPGFRATALSRLDREAGDQYNPDGIQYELAPMYHVFTTQALADLALQTAGTPFPVPASFLGKLRPAFHYPAMVMAPDKSIPPFNDSRERDDAALLALFRSGLALFPGDSVLLYGEARLAGKPATPGPALSCAFPHAGQAIMRSGRDEKALWLAADFGPYGMGHYHEDALSFVLKGGGRDLIIEGGKYPYNYFSRWRKYAVSSLAHNTVLVDGCSQARLLMDWKTAWRSDRPAPGGWKSDATADCFAGMYEGGYIPFDAPKKSGFRDPEIREAARARHVRAILFIKPDCFVVLDSVSSLDGKVHGFESLFHLGPDHAEPTSDGCMALSDDAGIRIHVSDPCEKALSKGRDGPAPRGFAVSGDSVRPVSVLRCLRKGAGFKSAAVLAPFTGKGDTGPRIEFPSPGHISIGHSGFLDELVWESPSRFRLFRNGSECFRMDLDL